ncbi:hypothetical protein QWJ34_02925 [Saccharibacillus sp. CPCC 101409]|uniref:hypothetical protein n=1 Tax=Saccharibacillus sp. CPCC 101409 TaxID=3058041 RepID=UPI0026711DA6|nr:hypothetical protein [Saccharibacillus sp. CPCC 101409]MDO3408712.1 hypothetical protein [Saccharibacillus sp. CPCC 101409]
MKYPRCCCFVPFCCCIRGSFGRARGVFAAPGPGIGGFGRLESLIVGLNELVTERGADGERTEKEVRVSE